MGLYLVVPRAGQRDRHPLALLSALRYLGGEAPLETVGAYWLVTARTVRRWAAEAEARGWVQRGAAVARLTQQGIAAWGAAMKEKVPAWLRGKLPLAHLALWGRIARRRAFGTRLLAQDVRCSRRTIQRALAGAEFFSLPAITQRYRTPVRWVARGAADRMAPPPNSPKNDTSLSLQEKRRTDRPRAPSRGASASLWDEITPLTAGLGAP